MSTPLPAMISEIDSVFSSVSTYADSMGAYLYNPATNPLPQFDTTKLVVDNVLEMIRNNKEAAVDLTSGALSSTVYKAAGIVRELNTRTMTKSMMYDIAVTQAGNVKGEVNGESGRAVAELRSQTPAQELGL